MSDATQITTEQDIIAGFQKQLAANPDAPEPAPEAAPVDDDPEIQDIQEELPEQEADSPEAPEAETPEATIQAPPGMTAEQQAHFAQVDPELQQFLVSQEAHRQADYTVKTQRLAEQRRETEAHEAEVARQRDQYAQILQGITQQELSPPPAALAETDPEEYQIKRAQYEERRDLNDAAAKELARVQAEQTAQLERNQKAFEASVREQLPSLIPAMADPTKAKAIEAEMKAYALSKGVSEDNYPRATAQEKEILWKAMQFDKGATGKAKGRKAPPRSQKPGAAARPGDTTRKTAEAGRQAYKKSMETQDLRHVFKARLEAEGK